MPPSSPSINRPAELNVRARESVCGAVPLPVPFVLAMDAHCAPLAREASPRRVIPGGRSKHFRFESGELAHGVRDA